MARPLEDWMIPLIKGMLAREDDQSDIAACFLINGGRVAEVHNSITRDYVRDEPALTTRARPIPPAPANELPPPPPYPSPFELLQAQQGLWAARVALQAVSERVEQALIAVTNAEKRMKGK